MTKRSSKLFKDQVRLTIWFTALAAFFIGLGIATYLWIHDGILLAGSLIFAPVFTLLALAFGVITLLTAIKLKK